jgi:hypothetical protein
MMDSIAMPPAGPRRRHMLAAVLVSAVVIAYYVSHAMEGRSLAEGEGVTYYMPMRTAVADAWRDGRWPLWNPYICGGMPLLGDCQAGAFYPPNLLYLWLGPVAATNIVILGGHILAVWGMVILLRTYGVSAWASAAGAIAFVFSGFMIAHMGHVTIANAAVWLPWLCWVTHKWCVCGRRRWLVAGVLLWSIQFMAGHPQIVVYSAIIVGMQVVSLLVRRVTTPLRAFGGLAMTAGLAVAICGIQIWPTLALSGETGRTLHASLMLFQNYRFAIQYTPLLWAPYLFGTQADTPLHWTWWGDWNFVEQAGYVGLLPWMLVPAAAFLQGGRARFGRAWAVIGGLQLIMAWNTDTPAGRLLFHVPIYNSFESAGRHLLGVILALSICAAVGLDALAEGVRSRRRRWSRRGVCAVAFIVLAILVGGAWGYEYAVVDVHYRLAWTRWRPSLAQRPWAVAPWAFIAPAVMTALSAWAVMRYANRPRSSTRAVVLAVLLVDVLSAGYLCAWRWRYEGTYRPSPPPPELARLLVRPESGQPPPRYLLFGPWGAEYAVNPQGNMRYHLSSLNGYGPFELSRFRDMMGGMCVDGQVDKESLLGTSRALDLWSCRYVIVRRWANDIVPSARNDPSRYRAVTVVGDMEVYENLDALPHARFVDHVAVASSDPAMLRTIESGRLEDGREFDASRVALVSSRADRDLLVRTRPTSGPAAATAISDQRSVRWLTYGDARLRLQTRSECDTVLVLAEACLDGWTAVLDGHEPVPIVRADYLLRAIRVPAGTHIVEMRYQPTSLTHGGMVSLAGLGGLALVALWPRRGVARTNGK